MTLEIKKMDTCISPLFGDMCAYLDLDDYAIEDSIKCTVVNIGDEIIPDRVVYNGNPYFSYETFQKYSKGNHYARIYVEVEYKSKELELPEYTYNTADGIDDYIIDLNTLHHIMNIRSVAYRKKKIKLNEFVWRGLLYFDQFGQTVYLFDQEFSSNTPYSIKNSTIDKYIFSRYCEHWSGTFRKMPEQNEVCPHCGETWTLINIADYMTIEQDHKLIGFHKNCLRIHNDEKQLQEFKKVFSKVYDPDKLIFTAIPNEYCPCERCASWFIVSTPDGDIKIGWRKRVINIRWLENYKPFAETFESEDVTKEFEKCDNDRYIHAWRLDKAIEYLNKARVSIAQ